MIDMDSLDGINIICESDETCSLQACQQVSTTVPSACSSTNQGSSNLLTCMLITANVGTIFDEVNISELWFKQLKSYLINIRPQLVAIHCQEIGGKNYESSIKYVSNFIDKIVGDESVIKRYNRVKIFMDENVEHVEKFTALGSLYLIDDSVENVKLYNFKTAQFDTVEGRDVYSSKSSNDKLADQVECVKFPQELFPECRWSRKGYMRTRWLFNDCQPLDLVNIHLFHDASNIIAMEMTPSPYAKNRQRALAYTLNRLSEPLKVQNHDEKPLPDDVPLFIFGDFNFRLDTSRVIERITEGFSPIVKRCANSNEILEIIYQKKKYDRIEDLTSLGSTAANKKNDEQNSDNNDQTSKNKIDYVLVGEQTITKREERELSEMNNRGAGDVSCHIERNDDVVMTVGKKLFDFENLDETFRASKNTEWLQELDKELDSFKSQLYEFKILFSPSYPFREDDSGGNSYMKTRCPAWCDRILFNKAGLDIICGKNLETNEETKLLDSENRLKLLNEGNIVYRLMGNSVPMGDHKPVLLYCQLNVSPKLITGGQVQPLEVESTAM